MDSGFRLKDEKMTFDSDPLVRLDAADPELAAEVRGALAESGREPEPERIESLVEDTLRALSMEASFGRAVGNGLAALAAETPAPLWEHYRRRIREAGGRGPEFGRHLAAALAPVIGCRQEALLASFEDAVAVLAGKGTYTLARPLAGLKRLLAHRELDSAGAFLDLLAEAFSQELSYNRSLQLTVALPRGVLSLSPSRRPWQIRRLIEVCRVDHRLVEPFLEGIEKGLDLLSEPALAAFSRQGLDRFAEQPDRGMRYFSLESKLGADACADLQITAALTQLREGLNRYLRARTGRPLAVRPASSLPAALQDGPAGAVAVFSDSRHVYLPESVRVYSRRSENVRLLKALVRLEAGLHEFGTHDFDLEKALLRIDTETGRLERPAASASDLEQFIGRFKNPVLAMDLFFIFEQGRIRRCVAATYPGLLRTVYPLLAAEFETLRSAQPAVLARLYERVVLGGAPGEDEDGITAARWADLFFEEAAAHDAVETAAVVTARVYPEAAKRIAGDGNPGRGYRPFEFPFGHRLRPDLVMAGDREAVRKADPIKSAVEQDGRYRIFRSDLVRALRHRSESLTRDVLEKLVSRLPSGVGDEAGVDLDSLDLDRWLAPPEGAAVEAEETGGPVFWYPEWNSRMDDYLRQHVRVRERRLGGDGGAFYARTLEKRWHLVARIRTAFEMLKPEGLKILRQWIEGDAFDHRALIDFAVDRRAGRTPSDRLYIKRLRQERDIAVLLLVDLSRSTANRVEGAAASVLDVEKEALVLFCEALNIVGDRFAIAGFSGTGRLGVDYFRIQNFDQRTTEQIRGRIGALAPQRSTRMGAAVRHATAQLEAVPCRVKLMLVLGDGFPNDADYKQGYAIADTRKAISEARARQVHVRAITVNLPADPKLDDLYGNVHHNVISDVRELPDRLLRVYRSLTRC